MDIQNEFIGAVYSGNLAEITALIKRGAKIGEDEILHTAAQTGNSEVLKLLLESGGREFIDQFDDLAMTPLTWAAKKGHISSMKVLLEAGAQVNAVETRRIGNTALREVVGDGNLEVIELLLRAGADPNIPGWMQMTAKDKAESQWDEGKFERNRKILDLLNARLREAEKILSQPKSKKSKKR